MGTGIGTIAAATGLVGWPAPRRLAQAAPAVVAPRPRGMR